MDDRFRKLERRIKWLTLGFISLTVVFFAAIVVFVACNQVMPVPPGLALGGMVALGFLAINQVRETFFAKQVAAREFIVVDEHSRTLARLGPQISDRTGKVGVGLSIGDRNSRAWLFSSADGAEMAVKSHGYNVLIATEDEFCGVAANGKHDAGAFVGACEGIATLRTEHGKDDGRFTCMIGAGVDGAGIQLERAGKAEINQRIVK